MGSADGSITDVLMACNDGDEAAVDNLVSMVYEQLKRIAHGRLGRIRADPTLNTTALVHEAFIKIGSLEHVPWTSRRQFFAIAGRAMRLVIVDYARQHRALKRGGGEPHVSLNQIDIGTEDNVEMLLVIDQALDELALTHARLVQVVECRYFAGLTEDETAQALGVSTRTVRRDWLGAKAWLADFIG
jgi:RNA polymerase sigma factor (TIGR02999 family)